MIVKEDSKLNRDLKTHCWLHSYQMDNVLKNEFMPPVISKAEGVYIYDEDGNKYLDAISGAYCVNVGYGRKRILQAAYDAASQIHFVSPFSAASTPVIKLARQLSEFAEPVMGKNTRVFFVNSGSEANDAAIKMVRAYARKEGKEDGHKIITRNNSYHGSTFGALSSCGIEAIKKQYRPLVPGFHHIPDTLCGRCSLGLSRKTCGLACAGQLKNVIDKEGANSVAAVLIEPMETSGRMIPPPTGYLQKVREICTQNQIPLILDEVITGFGRLSHWFGAECYNINPDIIVCSKGLTSGYDALSAVIVSEKIASSFSGSDEERFSHGSTLAGRPAAAAAALENIKIMQEENLFETSKETALYIEQQLKQLSSLPIVGEIRSEGMLFGIDLVDNNNQLLTDTQLMGKIRNDFLRNGLVTCTYSLRTFPIIDIAPPLIITKSQVDELLDILLRVLKKY